MPKNSRPDIQVLEARVVRLKAQLLEYTDIRTYEITKQRLSAVASELEECISIIQQVTRDAKEDDSVVRKVTLKEPEISEADEFEEDGDLSDVLFTDDKNKSNATTYSPKKIVGTYAAKLKECAEEQTHIIQVNQFCILMNSWFQERFVPEIRNTDFYYKAERIHEWVDLMILSAGKALSDGSFSEYKAYIDDWIHDLNTSKDDGWIIPLKVRQIESEPGAYTKEAIILERIIKPIIYSDDFYPNDCDTVAKIVIQKNGYKEDEITMEALLEACPKLIKTASFDASKYK